MAVDETVFNELLPELVTHNASGAGLCSFASGLAKGYIDPLSMWQKFRHQLSIVDASQRKDTVLYCFLSTIAQSHPEIAELILNEAVSDEILGFYFPRLQTAVKIDAQGVTRLKKSLDNKLASVEMYRYLACGGVHKSINDEDLCDLLQLLTSKTDGLIVTIDILQMRLDPNNPPSEVIKSLGQECLAQLEFDPNTKHTEQIDYELGLIADACLEGEKAATIALKLCENLAKSYVENGSLFSSFPNLLTSLAKQHPQAFLNGFLGSDIECFKFYFFEIGDYDFSNLFSHISGDSIIAWCEANPLSRYPKIAEAIVAYQHNAEKNCFELTPLFLKALKNAPDALAFLNSFKERFRPSIWSGSLADILEKGLILITQLKDHTSPAISSWAREEENKFTQAIKQERLLETNGTEAVMSGLSESKYKVLI